jgi:hypothetical protein
MKGFKGCHPTFKDELNPKKSIQLPSHAITTTPTTTEITHTDDTTRVQRSIDGLPSTIHQQIRGAFEIVGQSEKADEIRPTGLKQDRTTEMTLGRSECAGIKPG